MGYTVLIVDDSKLARMAIAKVLRTLHPEWVQVEAVNADEALASVRTTAIDITILDFNMPGRDGLRLAADLRERHPTMPVAVVSANHQTEIVTGSRLTGAAFLSKPVTQEALAAFLTDAVARLKAEGR
jgi:DNA-binding NarL/FixJ family response regulator